MSAVQKSVPSRRGFGEERRDGPGVGELDELQASSVLQPAAEQITENVGGGGGDE